MIEQMRVEDIQIYTRHAVHLTLPHTDARVSPRYVQGEIRPNLVKIAWLWEDGSWRLVLAQVSGPKVKKNGGDSQLSSVRDFVTWSKDGTLHEDTPVWLLQLIERYASTRPEMG